MVRKKQGKHDSRLSHFMQVAALGWASFAVTTVAFFIPYRSASSFYQSMKDDDPVLFAFGAFILAYASISLAVAVGYSIALSFILAKKKLSSTKEKRRVSRLLNHGWRIVGTVISFLTTEGASPGQATTKVILQDRQGRTYLSAELSSDEINWAVGDCLTVFIDPTDAENYHVDLSAVDLSDAPQTEDHPKAGQQFPVYDNLPITPDASSLPEFE